MMQCGPGETERDPAAIPAQGLSSGHDAFIVEHDRFLEELMKAVDEEEKSEAMAAVQEPRLPVPSLVSPRHERVRYSFD